MAGDERSHPAARHESCLQVHVVDGAQVGLALIYPRDRDRELRGAMTEITELLGRLRAGDNAARDSLFAIAYEELRRLAQARLRRFDQHTLLDTTALVHESYLRFLGAQRLRAEDRRAFFAYAAQVMRSVIVDVARQKLASKRGGDQKALTLPTQIEADEDEGEEVILKVHDALQALEQTDARLAQIVQMRYFGGYSEAEIAEAVGIGERTVQRDWQRARMILAALLK
jgi:RNA polymerase sigma factor (TIGR02999 family)